MATSSEITSKFASSELVQETVRAVEKEHNVKCNSGKASAFIPKLFKKVKYVTRCGDIKLKISAKYKNVSNPVFKLKTVKVWDKNGKSLTASEQFALTSDPFLLAYKNSQLVRNIRHFVENNYEVVCKAGRVRRGIIGGKANYFFFAKCKSGDKVVKIKIKSKVKVIGNYFEFDLTKYKLTFK